MSVQNRASEILLMFIAIAICGFLAAVAIVKPSQPKAVTPPVPPKIITVSVPTPPAQSYSIFRDNHQFFMQSTVMISGTMSDETCENLTPADRCNGSGVPVAVNHETHKTMILTNKHVVIGDAKLNCKVLVYVNNLLEPYLGTIAAVGDGTGEDLALVEVEGLELPPVTIAASEPKLFDEVFNVNIGNCNREGYSQLGHVVAEHHEFHGGLITYMDMTLWGGASGSPVYNMDGQLSGLVVMDFNANRLVHDNGPDDPDKVVGVTSVATAESGMITLPTIRGFLAKYLPAQ